ncbi:CCA tRNA nucleotidyltransferase [Afifella sp. IM 167]|uniref:CCA tRNA nucleotidyltransferase n=1 Tax=Afifella sp. IM 167 TaxID=2033586 RepID=UPI001CCB62F0|nr:CCA tRNA nucleotidyltransferase [Afifella sp. IM 167]MBZ8134861.1 CCA tRNA nucleotidyltransferase [Afifella sp. IM 167]
MSLPSLAGHTFLDDPALKAVLAALGGGNETRIVGGTVRNALLGDPVSDVDLATIHHPQEVMARADAAGLKPVATGIEHGTITVVAHGKPFEVTTLRADVETDGRHAVVRFTEDWAEDAARRDFTLNALYCDGEGHVFDPHGGYADLAARVIRFVGDPEERIREDYLRILRFFRFFAWYGSGRPDADGLKACARLKAGIATLSAERVWSELKRLLAAPDPSRALLWMRTTAVLAKALPECWGIDAIHRTVVAEEAEGLAPDPLTRLMAIIPPHHARIDQLATRLRLSRREAERLRAWADAPDADPSLSPEALSKLLYEWGSEPVCDRLLLALARAREEENAEKATALKRQLETARAYERPAFPLSGKDLIEAGHKEGPALGRLLAEIEGRWVDSGFALPREELLALATKASD